MKTLTNYWFLKEFDFFKKLEMPILMEICKVVKTEHIDKGGIVKMEAGNKECVFFLKKGAVKIMDSTNGSAKYVLKKGGMFGELSLYNEEVLSIEVALALEDSIVFRIESRIMKGLIEKDKLLKNEVLKVYGLRIRKLENQIQNFSYQNSKKRITEFIISYIDEFGIEKTNCVEAKNLLSHNDIANLTNTSRQTVNNVLCNLRKEKSIDYDSKYISILK